MNSKYILAVILVLLLFSGCSSGKFSIQEGDIRFKIPFDFPYSGENKVDDSRDKKMEQELDALEGM